MEDPLRFNSCQVLPPDAECHMPFLLLRLMKLPDFSIRRSTAFLLGSVLLGTLPPASGQRANPPPVPRAELTAPDTAPPRPEIVSENDPAAAPKPKPEVRPAQPRAKTPEDDLFDYSELLFSKGDNALAIRQYGEYLKVFPGGKYREEARFKIGEAHYRNQSWDMALVEFDGYLRDFPGGRNRAIVLYHAGESHRMIAAKLPTTAERNLRMKVAEDAYRATLAAARTGTYAAYAAFRLATLAYNEAVTDAARYKDAVRYFTIAAAQMPKEQPNLRFAALFLKGRSCKFTGAIKDATASFEEVIRTKAGNDYYEKALMEVATLDMEAGRQDAAMKKFEILAAESAAAETRAESMVSAGMIHADAGRAGEAIKLFEDAIKVVGAPLAQARARYGLVFAYFKQEAYDKVISAWRGLDYAGLDEATRARLLLIVGTSYAAIDQHLRAAEVFGTLEATLPEREEALEGGYKRLVSLFKMNDPALPEGCTAYVERWRGRKPQSDFLDKAWLVRGAYYFNRGLWELAAEAYQRVRDETLEPEKLSTYLYQRGFAESSCGDKGASVTLTKFIGKNPQDPRLPMAIQQRGIAELKTEDYPGALRDFELIGTKYPESSVAESAAYHAAKVKGIKQDYAGMAAGFQKLLTDFPQTKVAPEAWYWIGTGYFQQQKWKESVEPLRTAREKDLKAYYTDATLMIIGALTAQKQVEPLMLEVDGYLKGTQEKKISPDILRWLGRTAYERREYRAASRYLSLVVSYDDPRSTPPDLWKILGESQIENGSNESAVVALDHHLASEPSPQDKVRSLLLKGRGYFALGKPDEATKSAEAGLDLDKESLLSAQLRLLLGDIAMAANRFNEAISSYGLVMQNWEDPTFTPLSMTKLITAYEKSGDAANLAKADKVKAQLRQRFPRYQTPVSNP